VVTFGRDAGSESHEFVDVTKSSDEEVLRDDRNAIGNAQHRGDERFVVGRDPGEGQRRNVTRLQPPRTLGDDTGSAKVHAPAHGVDLSQQHLHVLRAGVDDANSPTGDECRGEVRCRDHAISDDVVARRMETFDAVDSET
jgi:hypothetical protein